METNLPDSFQNFDNLPDSAYVRVKTVAALLGCSVPTVWRMAKDGRLPQPKKISMRVTGFNVGQIRADLNRLANTRSV